MPYSLKGNCVIKTDSGETVKCHDTHAQAVAHLGALEANVSDAKKDMMMLSQEEAAYTTVSPQTGTRQCANCRWFEWSNMTQAQDGKAKMGTSSCHLVEYYPEPILPTGYCDRWEADPPEVMPSQTPVPVVIVEPADMEMEFTPAEPPATLRALRRLSGKPLPGYSLTKAADGRRLMVIFTSSGYKDREFEHVATKALAQYVESQWKGDAWEGDNVHLLWHLKNLGPIGDIVWAGMIEGFLVEIAKERNHLIARYAWDFIEAHPEFDWGASHGFKVREMADKDTYSEIRKFETSTLPRAFAAHPLTYSGVVKMVDVKKDPKAALLDEMYHIEDVAGLLATGGPKALNAALNARGVEAKALKDTEATPTQPVTEAEKPADYNALMAGLIEAQGHLLEQIQALGTKIAGEATARAALETSVKSQFQQVAADQEKVKAQLALAPRSVTRDIASLTALPEKEAAAIKENLPQEGSDFWFGAVPSEKR